MQLVWIGFPVDTNGLVQVVYASLAVAPITGSESGLKYDAQGRLVIAG